jgi:hypothetical protein
VSSIEPNDSSGEVDCGEEISRRFVIAGGDRTILLEFAEEVLDEVTRLVEIFVELALDRAVGPWRDHDRLSARAQRFDHPLVGIEGFVRHQGIGNHVRQQSVGTCQIMGLAGRKFEPQWIAQRIDERMNLGA